MPKLSAGDIGYIATGLKNPGQVSVGDTIIIFQTSQNGEEKLSH